MRALTEPRSRLASDVLCLSREADSPRSDERTPRALCRTPGVFADDVEHEVTIVAAHYDRAVEIESAIADASFRGKRSCPSSSRQENDSKSPAGASSKMNW